MQIQWKKDLFSIFIIFINVKYVMNKNSNKEYLYNQIFETWRTNIFSIERILMFVRKLFILWNFIIKTWIIILNWREKLLKWKTIWKYDNQIILIFYKNSWNW